MLPAIISSIENGNVPPVQRLPIGALRYIPTTPPGPLSGTDLRPDEVVGILYLWPSDFEGISEDEMLAKPPKDQVWATGYDVLPKLHGRGIGTAMISAGVKGWIDKLGIGKVTAVGFVLNMLTVC